jgi:hypothetical protein
MAPTQDGSGYGQFGAPRRTGPSVASRKGAVAIVVRSIGTDHHRNPHTGLGKTVFAVGRTHFETRFLEGPIALVDPDVILRRIIGNKQIGPAVVVEIRGRDAQARAQRAIDPTWTVGTRQCTDNGAGVITHRRGAPGSCRPASRRYDPSSCSAPRPGGSAATARATATMRAGRRTDFGADQVAGHHPWRRQFRT